MTWVYAVILACSAGFCAIVFARLADRLTTLLGIEKWQLDAMSIAALMALIFLMIAQAPAMMLCSAAILWIAGRRHDRQPLSFPVRMALVGLAVLLGIASLGTPHFNLPEQLPKAFLMGAVYAVWCVAMVLPMGAPSEGAIASYTASMAVFIVGVSALSLPIAIAGDAIVLLGAAVSIFFVLHSASPHESPAGRWVMLYLLGFLASAAAYGGAWWLGLLGILPVAVYTLLRRV